MFLALKKCVFLLWKQIIVKMQRVFWSLESDCMYQLIRLGHIVRKQKCYMYVKINAMCDLNMSLWVAFYIILIITDLICCATFEPVTGVLTNIKVFWDVTHFWLLNTDICKELAAITFRVCCKRLESLSTLVCWSQLHWSNTWTSLNCNLGSGFQITGDVCKRVICCNLFVLSTYKGRTEMEICVVLE